VVAQETRPLVICDRTGAPVAVAQQNRKGHTKSLESGDLWSLHPETGRLLPYPGGSGATVEDRGTWYRALLPGAQSRPAPEQAAQNAAAGSVRGDGGGSVSRSRDSSPEADDVSEPKAGGGDQLDRILAQLAALIHTRHQEMPEGSYTTHLFESGSEKIRKKVGEEAVEILLARGEELVSETADFLYHLLVLLEAEGVTLSQIAAELKKR